MRFGKIEASNEFIEHVAEQLWKFAYEDGTGMSSPADVWPEVENPVYYREMAQVAVQACLNDEWMYDEKFVEAALGRKQ